MENFQSILSFKSAWNTFKGDKEKEVQVWSFSAPYFPAFGLNKEIYGVNLRIQSKYGKIRTEKTPYLDIFIQY